MNASDMEIRILANGDVSALEAFLRPRMSSSMFLLSNARAAGLEDTGEPYTGTYAAAFEGNRILAVIGHFWTGILIPQAPVAPDLVDRLWRAAAEASGRPVTGVLGPADQADVIVAAIGLDRQTLQTDHREKLYSLRLDQLVVPESLASGTVQARLAAVDDIEVLTDWRLAYEAESLNASDRPERRTAVRESIVRGMAESSTWVLTAGGVPVATTGFNARLSEAVQVGGVYTPPPLRSRGYARCAVAGSLLAAREEGVTDAILFTAEDNLPAQKAYEALGFQHIGHLRMAFR